MDPLPQATNSPLTNTDQPTRPQSDPQVSPLLILALIISLILLGFSVAALGYVYLFVTPTNNPPPAIPTSTTPSPPDATGTDLSYIWIYLDDPDLYLTFSYQHPDSDPTLNPEFDQEVDFGTRTYFLAKPPTGTYIINLKEPPTASSSLTLNLFDQSAQSKQLDLPLPPGETPPIQLYFDRDNIDNTSILDL